MLFLILAFLCFGLFRLGHGNLRRSKLLLGARLSRRGSLMLSCRNVVSRVSSHAPAAPPTVCGDRVEPRRCRAAVRAKFQRRLTSFDRFQLDAAAHHRFQSRLSTFAEFQRRVAAFDRFQPRVAAHDKFQSRMAAFAAFQLSVAADDKFQSRAATFDRFQHRVAAFAESRYLVSAR